MENHVKKFEHFFDIVRQVTQGLEEGDPLIIGIFVAFIVVAFTILLFAVRGGANKRRGVLLVGLCDAGKSLIYSRLVFNKSHQTHTSMKENIGPYELTGNKAGKTLQLIDLPGHERIRISMFDQYKKSARALVFVIDSLSFQREIKDVAEFLYNVMADPIIYSHGPPIVIACNKHDQTLAKGSKIIQSQLEKEINTLRVTKAAALDGDSEIFLGRKDKPFSFSDMKPLKIGFVECSAKEQKASDNGLDPLISWLGEIA